MIKLFEDKTIYFFLHFLITDTRKDNDFNQEGTASVNYLIYIRKFEKSV